MLGWAAVQDVDWGRLFHAYGVADDTPHQLRKLTSESETLRAAAVDHLAGAVLHQGTIYPVTPAAVRVVAGLLGEPVLREPLSKRLATGYGPTTLTAVLAFLGDVGTSLNQVGELEPAPQPGDAELAELFRNLREDSDVANGKGWGSDLITVLQVRAVLALRDMAGEIQAAVLPWVSDAAASVRVLAVFACARWGALQADSEQAHAAAEVVQAQLAGCPGRDERAGLVLALGMLGRDVSPWLDDQDEAVRACAALFVRKQRATSILIAALTHPDRVNGWFSDRPAFFEMHTRFSLLGELIQRGVTIEELLPAAVAVIAGSTAMTADFEWGRILQVAFPEQVAAFKPGVRPPLPARLSPAQHAVLEALVANQSLWDPRNGNASFARMRVGLPNVREQVADYSRSMPSL
jgi:hypothetical protein